MAITAFDIDSQQAAEFGLISGRSGPHSSRTMALDDLAKLLDALPLGSGFQQYEAAVVDDNLLLKTTHANRTGTLRRLRELYSLDRAVPLFRVFRQLWELDASSRPLLALLVACARDPLLLATAGPVLETPVGSELIRQSVCAAIAEVSDGGMSDATIDKVARNTSASWSQSGHLAGRVRKIRHRVTPTPTAVTLAIVLAYATGHRGKSLLTSVFVQLLDADVETARGHAIDARRLGLIDLRQSGDVFDVRFAPLLTDREWRILDGPN